MAVSMSHGWMSVSMTAEASMCASVASEAACAAFEASMCASVASMCGCVATMMSSGGVSGGVATVGVYFSPHGLALLASLNQLWRLNHRLHSSVNLLHSSMDWLTVVASSGTSVSGTRMAIAIGLVGARVAVAESATTKSAMGSAVPTNLRARAGEARAVAVVLQGGLGDLSDVVLWHVVT